MIDLPGTLAAEINDLIESEITLVHKELIGGHVADMERYKLLMGKLEGLRIAARSVDTALQRVRMNDDD